MVPPLDDDVPLPSALTTVAVERHLRGKVTPWVDDQVVAEVPVALIFNGISHAVMMCTPQDLREMALGFALSEGIIDSRADCHDIDVRAVANCADNTTVDVEMPAVEVHLEIAAPAFLRLKEQRRSLAGRTGCGLCGIDSLQALDMVPQRMVLPNWVQAITSETLFRALAAMPAKQVLNAATGAVHAAGYATHAGDLVAVFEDVGRHNALDKLLGARALARDGRYGQPWPAEGFVIMSSRASYELVRKCARLNIPLLATISAPTSLAVKVAVEAGLQLWGLAREPRAVRYTL